MEESPVQSSGSNGAVERAVPRLGRRVDARERIVAFIPESAAYLSNRLCQGDDGKVSYERIKGKKPTILGLENLERSCCTKLGVLANWLRLIQGGIMESSLGLEERAMKFWWLLKMGSKR